MGLKYKDFKIRGIDVSEFNGAINWTKVQANFAAVRVGYGRVTDARFVTNWAGAKGKVDRLAYWYMDYYSHHNKSSTAYGISDRDWGKVQAETCWNLLKNDNEGIVFLDIEKSAVGPSLTSVKSRVLTIAQSFFDHYDKLSGKVNGIYTSISMCSFFTESIRKRPLWVAWYNESQSIESIKNQAATRGWLGKCLIWQYTSDGDIDDDGKPDGVSMGMTNKFLDLNGWLGTYEEYQQLFGRKAEVALYKIQILIYNLLVRNGPGTNYQHLRRANFPGEYSIYEEKNGYGRISQTLSEWVSLDPAYVKKLTPNTSVEISDAEKLARLWAAHPELH